ncbi:hypothetical protein [Streptomyces lavendulocolor]|uniref:hypothetical protein n=1 Tax=Streptomyces lavendulocolor TaxID=67316 RepID=UPI003C2C15AB
MADLGEPHDAVLASRLKVYLHLVTHSRLAVSLSPFGSISFRYQFPRSRSPRTGMPHRRQMAGMAAIMLHDLGARNEARSWFATASQAARESGDRQLHA